MFPSGSWRGFWEAFGFGRRWMEPLTLQFRDGFIEGEGRDCVGPFTFEGSYTAAGEVKMVKQYLGRHSVLYIGRVDGEGAVIGRWAINPVSFGPFALMPAIEDIADLPILTMAAGEDE